MKKLYTALSIAIITLNAYAVSSSNIINNPKDLQHLQYHYQSLAQQQPHDADQLIYSSLHKFPIQTHQYLRSFLKTSIANQYTSTYLHQLLTSNNNPFINPNLPYDLSELLELTIEINSPFYFHALIDRFLDPSTADPIDIEYIETLKFDLDKCSALTHLPHSNDITIINTLLNSIQIDNQFLLTQGLTKEDLHFILETFLTTLTTLDDTAPLEILQATAIHSRYLKGTETYIHSLGLFTSKTLGQYQGDHSTIIIRPTNTLKHYPHILIHEWSHLIMHILFNNQSNPYPNTPHTPKEEYEAAIHELKLRINELKRTTTFTQEQNLALGLFENVLNNYPTDQHHMELIVLYPQIIALGLDHDPFVQYLLIPLKNYWKHFISPKINHFIKTHNKHFPNTSNPATLQTLNFNLDQAHTLQHIQNHALTP